jgi:hypothetical protein
MQQENKKWYELIVSFHQPSVNFWLLLTFLGSVIDGAIGLITLGVVRPKLTLIFAMKLARARYEKQKRKS